MPVNITQGNPVQFVARFQTLTGSLVTPTSASITVNYPTTVTTQASSTITMTNSGNGLWTATWYSSNSIDGIVVWSVSGVSDEVVNPAAAGELRIKLP